MKPTKSDRGTYDKFDSLRSNGMAIAVKVYSTERFRETFPGWELFKKTKFTKKGTTVYCAYFQSSQHIQKFLDRMDMFLVRNKEWKDKIVAVHQVDPETGEDFDDPNLWKYGILILTNEPVDDEIEGWELVDGPWEADGLPGMHWTIYRSKENRWDEFKEIVEEDEELSEVVERIIPDLYPQRSIVKKAKNLKYFSRSERSKRKHITATRGGGSRQTKYEYPPDCVTKKQRQQYRRMMRKKRGG